MANYVRVSGVWREATEYFVKVDGTWYSATEVYTKIDGAWKLSIPFTPPPPPPPPPSPPPVSPPPTGGGGGGGNPTIYFAYCDANAIPQSGTSTQFSDVTSGCAALESSYGNPCNWLCGASPVSANCNISSCAGVDNCEKCVVPCGPSYGTTLGGVFSGSCPDGSCPGCTNYQEYWYKCANGTTDYSVKYYQGLGCSTPPPASPPPAVVCGSAYGTTTGAVYPGSCPDGSCPGCTNYQEFWYKCSDGTTDYSTKYYQGLGCSTPPPASPPASPPPSPPPASPPPSGFSCPPGYSVINVGGQQCCYDDENGGYFC